MKDNPMKGLWESLTLIVAVLLSGLILVGIFSENWMLGGLILIILLMLFTPIITELKLLTEMKKKFMKWRQRSSRRKENTFTSRRKLKILARKYFYLDDFGLFIPKNDDKMIKKDEKSK